MSGDGDVSHHCECGVLPVGQAQLFDGPTLNLANRQSMRTDDRPEDLLAL